MAHVVELQRSVDFYKQLGMGIRGSLRDSSGQLQPRHVCFEQADRMLTRASKPVIPSQQAVWFYLYSPGLIALREHQLSCGVKVSPITHPEYMPTGEIRLQDPDGYTLLIGQAG